MGLLRRSRFLVLAFLLAARAETQADPIGGREFEVGVEGLHMVIGSDAAGNVVATTGHAGEVFAARSDLNGTLVAAPFQVNGYTTGPQDYPALAVDASGSFAVVWVSDEQDGDSAGVFARRYDSAGAPLGGEFQVNTYTTSGQYHPKAAPLAGGGFVVVWMGSSQNDDRGVVGQRFDAAGTPVGGEFQVNTYTTSVQLNPVVAGDPGGGFLVAWYGYGGDEPDRGIYARRYDSAGVPLAAAFHVNTFTPGIQFGPVVATDGGGRSVILWTGSDEDGAGVVGQRYDPGGAPLGPEFQVNSYGGGSQVASVVATDSAGAFVALYDSARSGGNIFGRRFDATGVPLGPEFQLNIFTLGGQAPAGAVLDATGDFTGFWWGVGDYVGNHGLRGRRYTDPASVPVSGTRLLVADNADPSLRRINLRLEDAAISTTPGVSPNPVVAGAVLHVFNGTGSGDSACIALPAARWSTRGVADTPVYVYRDTTGASGPCQRGLLRGRRAPMLKLACRARQQPISYSLDEPTQGSVGLTFTSGSATYCALFGGTIVRDSAETRRFLARNASAPSACPVPPVACP